MAYFKEWLSMAGKPGVTAVFELESDDSRLVRRTISLDKIAQIAIGEPHDFLSAEVCNLALSVRNAQLAARP